MNGAHRRATSQMGDVGSQGVNRMLDIRRGEFLVAVAIVVDVARGGVGSGAAEGDGVGGCG